MNKTWLVLQHEFQVMTSRWGYRIFVAGAPVLVVLALAGIAVFQAVQQESPAPVGTKAAYVDMTTGPDGSPLFTRFRQQGRTEFVPYPDEASAVQALLNSEVQQVFIIPEDYLTTGIVREVRLESSGLPSSAPSGANTPLGSFLLANLFADAPPHLAQRARVPYLLQTVEVDETGAPVTDGLDAARLGFFLVAGVLLLTSVFMTSGYLLQGLSDEKENRVMEVLLSSIRPDQLLVGKLLGLGAAGLLQMLVWVLSGVAFLLVLARLVDIPTDFSLLPSPEGVAVALAYFLLGYFFFGTLMAALGAVTTTQREANQVTFIVVLPGIAPLWFLQALMSSPDGTLATVLSFVPFTAPIVSLVRLGMDAMPWYQVAISLALLTAGVVLAVLMTSRLFRAYLLMYGQRPSLRQLLLTLRGA